MVLAGRPEAQLRVTGPVKPPSEGKPIACVLLLPAVITASVGLLLIWKSSTAALALTACFKEVNAVSFVAMLTE